MRPLVHTSRPGNVGEINAPVSEAATIRSGIRPNPQNGQAPCGSRIRMGVVSLRTFGLAAARGGPPIPA
jgi:hypothetical protein